ncbi:hypothetical protein BKA62DRAFT_798 [Auriculariales sp. MPI-PUGE-AT-0066]|nr:hypothetical protein BKA62DRAFT_798 [Auriculariales sp. MPI-PUGE-AT-0066]
MSHSSRGPRLGIFTTSVDDPFVVKSCAPSTPGLTSPGPFSSPNMAFSSEFERCDTPSSATSFDIQQSESRFGKIGSSPDPFWLRQLPTATKQQQSQHTTLGLDLKMETRSDLADDDSDIESATTSLQRAKSNVTTSSVSGAGEADLALAQLLLDFRDGPQRPERLQTLLLHYRTDRIPPARHLLNLAPRRSWYQKHLPNELNGTLALYHWDPHSLLRRIRYQFLVI